MLKASFWYDFTKSLEGFLSPCSRSKHFCTYSEILHPTVLNNLPANGVEGLPAKTVGQPSGTGHWKPLGKLLSLPKINFSRQFSHETDVEMSKMAENLHARIFLDFPFTCQIIYIFDILLKFSWFLAFWESSPELFCPGGEVSLVDAYR